MLTVGMIPLERCDVTDDERAIRGLVERWMEASLRGDIATVLALMTDDALFMGLCSQ